MSECKETVERPSGDMFWWLCCYVAVEELRTSDQGYRFLNADSEAYCHISSSSFSLAGHNDDVPFSSLLQNLRRNS